MRDPARLLFLSKNPLSAEATDYITRANPVHQQYASRINAAGWSLKDWGFTHMLTMCICVEKPLLWHGGSLTQSGFFFWTGDSHCIPLLGLWGLPLQIPLCVYTAAVQYGVFLICSIKHIVYKSVCLLGFFQGSNYQVKYHSKNYFVYSCILMYEWEN